LAVQGQNSGQGGSDQHNNTVNQSAYAYQASGQQPMPSQQYSANQNALNRSYEANQIPTKLTNAGHQNAHIGGRSQSGQLVNNNNIGSHIRGMTMSVPGAQERRKLSLNYSTQLPNNQTVQQQQQMISIGANYGH
jgi:hypothetical protein